MSKASFSARAKAAGKQLRMIFRHIVFHNGWIKLLAVLISVILWAGLISQDDSLTRDKTWQNVNITVSGADTLRRNGYVVVSDMDQLLSNVTVTAAVPQRQYETAETSAYNLRVDLSRISGTGKQELKILSTASGTYGKVVNTVPSALTVDVEDYVVRQRIPVSVTVTGDYQNGWYRDWYIPSPSVDPALISVNGPRSLVQTISRARVFLDPDSLDWTEESVLTTGEIKLYNRAGELVESPLLGITTESLMIDSVLIEANALPTKAFSTEEQIGLSGSVRDGYRMVSMKISPETVRVAAKSEILEQLDDLPLDQYIIDLQTLQEGTTVFNIKVQKPSEDAVLSNDTVIVTLEVEKVEE